MWFILATKVKCLLLFQLFVCLVLTVYKYNCCYIHSLFILYNNTSSCAYMNVFTVKFKWIFNCSLKWFHELISKHTKTNNQITSIITSENFILWTRNRIYSFFSSFWWSTVSFIHLLLRLIYCKHQCIVFGDRFLLESSNV